MRFTNKDENGNYYITVPEDEHDLVELRLKGNDFTRYYYIVKGAAIDYLGRIEDAKESKDGLINLLKLK